MRLLHLRARDLLAFEEVDVDLRGAGSVVGVRGRYAGEDGRSNRSGKSSLVFDLPLFALSGWSRTGTAADVVRRGCDEGWAEVEVEALGRTFTVRATQRDRSTSFDVSGFEGLSVADAKAKIEELLGISVADLRSVSLFEQGDVLGFLAGDQRRVLARWLDQSKWESAERVAAESLRVAEAEAVRASDAHAAAVAAGENLAALRGTVEVAEANEAEATASLREAEEASRCEAERAAVEVAEADVRSAVSAREAAKRAAASVLAARRSAATAAKAASERAATDARSAATAASRSLATATRSAGDARAAVDRARRVKATADEAASAALAGGEVDAPCHVTRRGACGPLVEMRRVEAARVAREAFDAAVRAAADVAAAVEAAEEASGVAERARSASDRAAKVATETETARDVSVRTCAAEIAAAEAESRASVESAERAVRDANEVKRVASEALDAAKAAASASDVADLRAEAARLRDETSAARVALRSAEDAAGRVEELAARVEAARRTARSLRVCRSAFGREGIPARVVEGHLDALAADANEFLDRLGAEPRVEWRTWRELQRWQAACYACGCVESVGTGERRRCRDCGTMWRRERKEDFAAVLRYGAVEAPLASDSGGGKTLVALAVRFALSRLVARARGAEADMLVLDEPFAALDPVNLRSAVSLVTDVLGSYGVRQVFLVSHVEEVQDAVSDVLTVVREGSVSRVETSWGAR